METLKSFQNFTFLYLKYSSSSKTAVSDELFGLTAPKFLLLSRPRANNDGGIGSANV